MNYDTIDMVIKVLDKNFFWPERYHKVRLIVISDLNELGWKCFKLFKHAGFKVCVIGEKWEWFGFISGYGYLNYPDYAKLYIYSEGTEPLRKEKEYGKLHFPNVNSSLYRLLHLRIHIKYIKELWNNLERMELKFVNAVYQWYRILILKQKTSY